MTHTALPWIHRTDDGSIGGIDAADGTAIAQTFQVRPLRDDLGQVERRANAAFIVKACNSHEALISALQRAVEWNAEHGDTRHQWYADAIAAIKQAGA